jgi:hypothetical protein
MRASSLSVSDSYLRVRAVVMVEPARDKNSVAENVADMAGLAGWLACSHVSACFPVAVWRVVA